LGFTEKEKYEDALIVVTPLEGKIVSPPADDVVKLA